MKIKTKLCFSALVLFFFGSSQAAPIINEFAADLSSTSYSASATYLPGTSTYQAENAFNGGIWNAGNWGWHWIQADMGMTQTLTELKLTIAQSPNGFTQHQVYLSDSYIGNNYSSLTPIFSQSGFTTNGTILDITLDQAYSGQFLLILSHGGSSWTALGDGNGRTDWSQASLQNNGGSNNVPEPSILLLMGSGLLLLGRLGKKHTHKKQA